MNTETFVYLKITQNKKVKVSGDDYLRVSAWSWHYDGRYSRGYPHGIKEYLHRYIMDAKKGEVVDHISGNKLDCRRSNLRVTSSSFNSLNQGISPRNKTGLRGVSFYATGDYVAEFNHLGIRYRQRGFKSAIDASDWYEESRAKILGDQDPRPLHIAQ